MTDEDNGAIMEYFSPIRNTVLRFIPLLNALVLYLISMRNFLVQQKVCKIECVI